MNPLLALVGDRRRMFLLADQAIVSGSNFGVGVLLARALGLEGYGAFTMAWLVVLIFSSLHQAIMVAPLYALLPRSANGARHLAATLRVQQRITTGSFLLLVPAIHLGMRTITPTGGGSLPWSLAAATAVFLHQDMLRRVLFAQQKERVAFVFDLFAYGLQVPLLLIVGVKDASTALFIIAMVLAVPTIWLHKRIAKHLPRKADMRGMLGAHWRNGRALVFTAVLQWSSGNLFLLAAGSLLGASAMGALRMAQNLMGVLNVLFLALENSVPLSAARVFHEQGSRALAGHMRSALFRAALPTMAVVGAVVLFPDALMAMVYGNGEGPHAWLLTAFALHYLLVFLGTFLRFALRTIDRNDAILHGYIITTLFSLASAKALVGHFGLSGVMLGLFSVQIINLLIYTRAARELWQWKA